MIQASVSRAEKREILYNLYEEHQEEISYEKNVLMPLEDEKPKRKNDDHPYCRRSKRRKRY